MELEIATQEPNKYSVNELNSNDKCVINENKYGIHVNLSDVETVTIDDLLSYINYVNTQESTLHTFEQQKEDFKNIYFMKDNKDNN
jgi:hypothetical protein